MIRSLLHWHPLRWVFVIVGMGLAVFAWEISDAAIGIFAFFVAYQGLMNVGCIKICYMFQRRNRGKENSDEISYEEIL